MSGPLVNSHASLESVTTIVFSHDKSFIASRYDDGSIKIWDITQHHLISKGPTPVRLDSPKMGGLSHAGRMYYQVMGRKLRALPKFCFYLTLIDQS